MCMHVRKGVDMRDRWGCVVGCHSCRPTVDPVPGNRIIQVRAKRGAKGHDPGGKGTDFTKRYIFKSKGPTGDNWYKVGKINQFDLLFQSRSFPRCLL